MKRLVAGIFKSLGYEIQPLVNKYPDIEQQFMELYNQCKTETMTSVERMYGLYKACEYVTKNKVSGDFVECGVWRGGSSMMAAKTFKALGDLNRNFYLYDTYEGMSLPTEHDISIKNEKVLEQWQKHQQEDTKILAKAALDIVKQNMSRTAYPEQLIHYVKGKVEDTIPNTISEQIALLRLDTDWYESTKHELQHLYPRLISGGILIIDDYGHWQGSRKAVDEYFMQLNFFPYLHRLDYTGRLFIKP